MLKRIHLKCKTVFKIACSIANNLIFERKQTYCHLLWDSVFIDNKGTAYTCCHSRPWKIGNIYKKHLTAIINNGIMLKIYKLMSLHKSLYCSFGCTLIGSDKKKIKPESVMGLDHPKRILILCGEFCNISCIMCPQNHRSKEMLDVEMVKKNVDWSRFEEIMLQGGEILAMKEAKELYLWLTRELNKKVDLLTNGILINDEWANHLVNGSNAIVISVNAATRETHELINRGSDFFKVINNIKKLVALKNQLKQNVQIIYKYSIVPENVHEIPDAITLACSLGCDQITYGYDVSVPDYIKKNNELTISIKNRLVAIMGSDVKIRVDRSYLERLGLV